MSTSLTVLVGSTDVRPPRSGSSFAACSITCSDRVPLNCFRAAARCTDVSISAGLSAVIALQSLDGVRRAVTGRVPDTVTPTRFHTAKDVLSAATASLMSVRIVAEPLTGHPFALVDCPLAAESRPLANTPFAPPVTDRTSIMWTPLITLVALVLLALITAASVVTLTTADRERARHPLTMLRCTSPAPSAQAECSS